KLLLSDIWSDKRLLTQLAYKDFVRRFSGTYFGVLWSIIQPLLTIIVYYLVFQYGFRSGDVGEIPFIFWFICGIVPWLFISEAFSSASNSFLDYSYLIKKVKFNINILPMVKILSAFFVHAFFLGIIIIVCMVGGYFPTLYIIQILYFMACSIVLLFSMSLITSSIMVFFRDLNQLISIILLIGMWGTPIAWNLEVFSPKAQMILKFNPFYYLVEGYRDAILGRKWFWERPMLTIYFWTIIMLFLFVGVTVYVRMKPHFADTV
ncbi:ABC transporter permease, partial [bacterium]|nr:ABC transporter permease [bacterium]